MSALKCSMDGFFRRRWPSTVICDMLVCRYPDHPEHHERLVWSYQGHRKRSTRSFSGRWRGMLESSISVVVCATVKTKVDIVRFEVLKNGRRVMSYDVQVLTAAVSCGRGTEVDFVRDELSCDLRRNIFSLTTPTHKPHTVRRGVLEYYVGQSDHGSMIKVWRCSRTLHARPTLATRCFTTTGARREVRSLQELPDRICAGLHGMDNTTNTFLARC
jgi:hypothetical protein